jgi:hypothetical protein
MMLGRVMPEPPDFDLHTLICPRCEFVKCVVNKEQFAGEPAC